MIDIPIKLLDGNTALPKYAHKSDAGIDLASTQSVVIKPFERVMIHCGFSLEIPSGYAGLVLPRSGLGAKHGVTLPNSPGLIDSGYRGEIMVPLINLDAHNEFRIEAGDRVAQLVIIKVPEVNLLQVDNLSESDRGNVGFGSSGIH